MLISWPVVMPTAALLPEAMIALAPSQEINSVQA